MPAMTFRSTYAYGATLLKIGHSFGRATPYFLTGLRTNFNLSGDDSSRPIMGLTAGVGVVVDGVLPTGTSLGLRVNKYFFRCPLPIYRVQARGGILSQKASRIGHIDS